MFRLLATALALIGLALPAIAGCGGQDLSRSMPSEARARMEVAAAAVPFAHGLMWQAREQDGTELTVIGTYHGWDSRQAAQMAALAPALVAADLVVTEITSDDEKALMALIAAEPGRMFLTEGPSLLTLMGDDWPALAQAMKDRGVPDILAAKFQPWYAMMMLGFSPCLLTEAKAGRQGLDKQILAAARQATLETRGLDDPEAILDLLSSGTRQEHLAALRAALRSDWAGKDLSATLLELYFEGRTWESWNVARFLDLGLSPADQARLERMLDLVREKLLEDRNRAWIDKLLPMTAGKRAVVAVGAAHLPGEAGLLNLLHQRGFVLTPADAEAG